LVEEEVVDILQDLGVVAAVAQVVLENLEELIQVVMQFLL
jgi:hypothetical protein